MSIFNNQFIWKLGKKAYKTPGGQYYDIFQDMLDQTHLLIAGSTGSGKSVLINGLITHYFKARRSMNLFSLI